MPSPAKKEKVGLDAPKQHAAGLCMQETFSWTKQWYAVTLLNGVDKTRPNAIELLGKNLVLWYHDGTWTCFADECPHRLAPLSGGCSRLRPVPAQLVMDVQLSL